MNKNINTDFICGIIGFLIMGFFLSFRGDIGRLSIMFPNAVLWIMAGISGALVIKGLARPEMRPFFTEGNHLRVIIAAATLFGWVIGIIWIGFYVSSLLAFSFLAYYLALARRKVSLPRLAVWIGIIALEIGFFDLIFSKLLFVPLPRGILF